MKARLLCGTKVTRGRIDGGVGWSFISQGPSGSLVLVLGLLYTFKGGGEGASKRVQKSDSHFGHLCTFGGRGSAGPLVGNC